MKTFFLLSAIVALSACSPAPEVTLTVKRTIQSPDRAFEAVVVNQDPGALGAASTAVFVRVFGSSKIERKRRVFVAMRSPPQFDVQWSGKNSLRISYPQDTEVRYFRDMIDQIRVDRIVRDFATDATAILAEAERKQLPNQAPFLR